MFLCRSGTERQAYYYVFFQTIKIVAYICTIPSPESKYDAAKGQSCKQSTICFFIQQKTGKLINCLRRKKRYISWSKQSFLISATSASELFVLLRYNWKVTLLDRHFPKYSAVYRIFICRHLVREKAKVNTGDVFHHSPNLLYAI